MKSIEQMKNIRERIEKKYVWAVNNIADNEIFKPLESLYNDIPKSDEQALESLEKIELFEKAFDEAISATAQQLYYTENDKTYYVTVKPIDFETLPAKIAVEPVHVEHIEESESFVTYGSLNEALLSMISERIENANNEEIISVNQKLANKEYFKARLRTEYNGYVSMGKKYKMTSQKKILHAMNFAIFSNIS